MGSLELLQFPVSSLPSVSAALRLSGPEAALRVHAEEFLTGIVADRSAGCGSDYSVVPIHPEVVQTDNGPAIHYGFAARRGGGTVLERVEHFAGLRASDSMLVLVHASATGARGCLDTEGEFAPADLAALVPLLSALIVQHGLPEPTPN